MAPLHSHHPILPLTIMSLFLTTLASLSASVTYFFYACCSFLIYHSCLLSFCLSYHPCDYLYPSHLYQCDYSFLQFFIVLPRSNAYGQFLTLMPYPFHDAPQINPTNEKMKIGGVGGDNAYHAFYCSFSFCLFFPFYL